MISVMGKWAAGDPMPGLYDSIVGSVELTYKEYIRANYAAGWRLASAGMKASAPVVLLNAPGPPVAGAFAFPPVPPLIAITDIVPEPSLSPTAVGPDPGRIAALHEIPDTVRQVANSRSSTVHFYLSGGWTSCGNFMCGAPNAGYPAAVFASGPNEWSPESLDHKFSFCSNCYSGPGMVRIGAVPFCSDANIDLASPLFDSPASDNSPRSASSLSSEAS